MLKKQRKGITENGHLKPEKYGQKEGKKTQ
jgi:hypothetical protein